MRTNRDASRRCANEGCRRPAQETDRYCETCAIERSLYRRDLRSPDSRVPDPTAR